MPERARVRYRNPVFDSARWDGFELRPDDIIISTPPKCGTTWTQMICALLIFQTPTFDHPVSKLSPWLDMLTRPRAEVVADLDAQRHRRFIKTHTPLDGLPWDDRVTYIDVGRDPRDVGLSMDHHISNMDLGKFFSVLATTAAADGAGELPPLPTPPAPDPSPSATPGAAPEPPGDRDRFWQWVDNPTPPSAETSSLLRTLKHHETFWDQRAAGNVVLLHYDDLRNDLGGQMRALAGRLGIEVDEARWPALVDAATFDRMRENAATTAPNTDVGIWRATEQFFHRGTSGQWRDLLDDDDLRRYQRRVAQIVGPDIAAWVHHSAG